MASQTRFQEQYLECCAWPRDVLLLGLENSSEPTGRGVEHSIGKLCPCSCAAISPAKAIAASNAHHGEPRRGEHFTNPTSSAITASQMKALSFSQFTAIATPLVKRYMTANVSATDILNYFLANPSVSDAQVVMAMDQLGVSPLQVANALSVPLSVVQVRYEASAGLVYANLQAPFVALGLQANGATFLDIASDMYTLGVTPSQFRNAFLGINIAQ